MNLKYSLSLAVTIALGHCLLQASAAQPARPPVSKVEILVPAPEAELHGTVAVRVRITPPEGQKPPAAVYCGIGGGPPWVRMERDSQAGEWTAETDSAMVPNGAQELRVVTDERRVRAAVKVNTKNPFKVFVADLHGHTSNSDGALTPEAAHKYARDVAKLDVFVLTDHLEQVDDTEWLDAREVAWDFNEDGKFVALPGLEWTKKWGHVNIFDPKTRHWPEDPQAFYQALADAEVVAKFNHPGTGEKSHNALAYSAVGDKAIELMEVRRPEEEQAFLRALKLGWHIAPDGSSDTHSPNWGNVGRWTGILAPSLSKRCIWDALKNRRVYSSLDRNCQLQFTVNGAVMGTILDEPVEAVEASVVVEDADAEDVIAKVELFEDGAVVETVEPTKPRCEWKTTRKPKPGPHYYFAKVTQRDGNQLWSAPVWVKVAAAGVSAQATK
jgi:hypothetical protein